ncbi:MAG TPA: tol-pal system protein YbgF [Xanthobacteraceae bacterium]|jgi:tol-pal system protein YbgF
MAAFAVGANLSPSFAQDSESPGLLNLFFGGSERISGERNAPQQSLERTAQVGGSDLLVRLERLEAQVRQLTGTIEQLQFRNQQLENQVRRMQEDAEYRGAARSPPQGRSQAAVSPPAPGPSPAPARHGDAFDPTLNPTAPGAPRSLGGMPPGQHPGPGDMADASPGSPTHPGPGPGGGATLATLPPTQTPKDEFDLAYGYVLHRDYALAEDSFHNFLSKYPSDRLAGEATFWLGESLFQRQRFREAAEAFLNVSTKFEGNPRAPDALLRLGQSLASLGEKEAACASLGEVIRKFPRTSAALKQAVEREQKRDRC